MNPILPSPPPPTPPCVAALSAAQLVELWEAAQGLPPHRRAMRLLAAAVPGTDAAFLGQMSIGRRDSVLMALRTRLWGRQIEGVAPCPACGQTMEMALDLGQFAQPAADAAPPLRSARVGRFDVTYRPVCCADLDAALADGHADAQRIRRAVLSRCVHDITHAGGTTGPTLDSLSHEEADALARLLAEADHLADVSLALTCPECGHEFSLAFDIGGFLWDEIHAFAWRVLREVHQLAWAYGWSERDVLAMSAVRRQTYLSMLGT